MTRFRESLLLLSVDYYFLLLGRVAVFRQSSSTRTSKFCQLSLVRKLSESHFLPKFGSGLPGSSSVERSEVHHVLNRSEEREE